MATLYIRTLSAEAHQQLKDRAKRNRRSVSQEAAVILEAALARPEDAQQVWDLLGSFRERLRARYGTFTDSTPLVREDRQR